MEDPRIDLIVDMQRASSDELRAIRHELTAMKLELAEKRGVWKAVGGALGYLNSIVIVVLGAFLAWKWK